MSRHLIDQSKIPDSPNDQQHWGQIPPGAEPLVIWETLCASKHPVLIIAKNAQHANALENALHFFRDGSHHSKEDMPVRQLADWETLPYDVFSPHEDIISSRLDTLSGLARQARGAVIVALQTLLQRLPPPEFLSANSFRLRQGEALQVEGYRKQLDGVGYRRVDTVYEHGEYAVRGAIFDVFPMGSELPVRIELFDEEVESLRCFDPESQRSLKPIEQLSILPANEFPWDKNSRMDFRNRWLDRFPNAASNAPLLRDLKEAIKPHGIEYYTPLFFGDMASLFDYLPEQFLVIAPSELDSRITSFLADVHARYEDRRHDIQRPILSPGELFLEQEQCFGLLKPIPRIILHESAIEASAGRQNLALTTLASVAIDDRSEQPLTKLKSQVDAFQGKTLLVAESAGRREIMLELFKESQFSVQPAANWQAFIHAEDSLAMTVGGLFAGFSAPDAGFQVITETELYGQHVQQSRRRKATSNNAENAVRNLTELQIGSPVVHIDHGVGRYRGLETISAGGETNEFLTLEYADQARLYVPVSSLHLISRYSGTDELLAPLHRLGTEKWSVAKQKAMEKVRDSAAELLEVYAKREAREGYQYEYPGNAYRAFCASFPFEETADQANAINAVIQDMTKQQPMDRLVCGDVGFGKTEVAMRAAFIATHNSKQVAILVPTTLLAQQHYESFVDRFADTPVRVEVLSRFKTTKEQNATIKDVESGKVDILVGTHKLIQGGLTFSNLGLLIIDEEHRFGVQQKEKLKALRAEVDILTLTATPIPRTLNMAMGGIRDLSIIATAPAKRLSVKTFIREREEALIRESVLREILRGGQVYYLFNDVQNIEKEVAFIQGLIPEARVGFAHGQMRERELEQAMSDFYHMRFNILICSTIIETGIDIPNANTIIIDRADKFGLAQLHQLRGRVGRSHHQAYAYLLTPPSKRLSKDAEKRLEAIEASQDLGAGFMLATHDLEIRGAGELLGEEQSGQIQSVGYSLYMELLERAVVSLQEGRELNLEQEVHGCEVSLSLSAIIPEDYLPDVHNRLILYKRISNAKNKEELSALQVEMIDRFGLLPEPTKNLFKQMELKFRLEAMGIGKLDASAKAGKLDFLAHTTVEPLAIVQLVQARPDLYRMEGATQLKFALDAQDEDALFTQVHSVLDKLAGVK